MFGNGYGGLGSGPSMVGYGISGLVWLIAFIVVGVVLWQGRHRSSLWVLTRFIINEDPAAEIGVEIAGRVSGIVSWVLTLLKLNPEVELTVSRSEVSIRNASLSGTGHVYVPLNKISATVCDYHRSMLALGFTILFGVGFVLNLLTGFLGQNNSDLAQAFGFLIFAAIAALVYYLSKKIRISLETMHPHGVVFKRSVIGNVSVDLSQALRAIAVVNARALAAQTGVPAFAYAAAASSGGSPVPASPPVNPGQCSKCGNANAPGIRFCENCGSPLA